VDIQLLSETSFKSRIYRDQSGRDLLIGLEKTSPLEIELLTDGIPRIDWETLIPTQVAESDDQNQRARRQSTRNQNRSEDVSTSGASAASSVVPSGEDVSYNQIRENIKFDVVVLDAGHGGHDPGSLGYGGVREKEIALNITKKVGKYIETYLPEVKVVYTRSNDTFVELHERGSIANRAEGDLFVSIHCNAFSNRNAFGSEVFFLGLARTDEALETMKKENSVIRFEENSLKTELTEEEILIYELANAGYLQNSQRLAEKIEYQFSERARRRSRGVKQAGFMVLYHASMPAILVELGFISNPNEAKYLSSEYGQDIMASAIFRAIRDYKVAYDASFSSLGSGQERRTTSGE
jgi:N-acetylmuramoyl-L-alanine amidase